VSVAARVPAATKMAAPSEPNAGEDEYYAPGVGLLVDESLRLVRHGMADRQR